MFEMMPLTRAMMSPFYDIDKMTRGFFGEAPVRAFRTDIQETGDGYVLEAELPGFRKEDIAIDVEGDQLTITPRSGTHFVYTVNSLTENECTFSGTNVPMVDIPGNVVVHLVRV